jgi:hypothetical protein
MIIRTPVRADDRTSLVKNAWGGRGFSYKGKSDGKENQDYVPNGREWNGRQGMS